MATFLVHVGSSESKDSDERMEKQLNAIASHLGLPDSNSLVEDRLKE